MLREVKKLSWVAQIGRGATGMIWTQVHVNLEADLLHFWSHSTFSKFLWADTPK